MRWPAGTLTPRQTDDAALERAAEQKAKADEIVSTQESTPGTPVNSPGGGTGVPAPVPFPTTTKLLDVAVEQFTLAPSPLKSDDNPARPWDYDVLMNPQDFTLFRKMEKVPVRFMKLATTASEMVFPIAPPLSFADPDLARVTTPPSYRTITVKRGEALLGSDGVLVVVI